MNPYHDPKNGRFTSKSRGKAFMTEDEVFQARANARKEYRNQIGAAQFESASEYGNPNLAARHIAKAKDIAAKLNWPASNREIAGYANRGNKVMGAKGMRVAKTETLRPRGNWADAAKKRGK